MESTGHGADGAVPPQAPEQGVGVLLTGVLGGLALLFVTRHVLDLPAVLVGAVVADLWLARRAGSPLLG
jgi:hypothetical protein